MPLIPPGGGGSALPSLASPANGGFIGKVAPAIPQDALPEMPGNEKGPDPAEPQAPPARTFRPGCLFALALLLAAAASALAVLNGPGFRLLARQAGLKAAASQGLKGDFRVEGTLLSGFRLSGIDLSDGKAGGTSIRIADLSLDYRAPALLSNPAGLDWLDAAGMGKAEIRLVLPAGPTDPDKKTKTPHRPEAGVPDSFSPLWNLLDADLAIADLTLSVVRGDRVISVESLRFSLPRGGEGSLRASRLALPGVEPLAGLDAAIRRDGRRLEIGPLPLPGQTELQKLVLTEPQPGGWTAEAAVGVGGGTLEAAFRAPGEVDLNLRRGNVIDLSQIRLPFRGETGLRGSVTALALGFRGDFATPSTWRLDGKLVASKAGRGEHTLDSVLLRLEENRLILEAIRNRANLLLTASAPLDGVGTASGLRDLPLDLALKLEVPSLADQLSTLTNPPPLDGAVTIEARELQIAAGRLRSGSLLLEPEGLLWNGTALPGGRVAAQVEGENFLRLAAEFGLDERNHLHLDAGLDTGTLDYEGEARGSLDTTGRLGVLLSDLGLGSLSGAAGFDWKGTGSLREPRHRGGIDLTLASLAIRDGTELEGGLSLRYENRSAELANFVVRAGDVALGGTGKWDGKALVLPDWKLQRGDHTPLTLQLGLPLGAGGGGGFLAQPGPLSVRLELDGLAPGELTRFWSGSVPLAGALEGRIEAEGSFDSATLTGDLKFRPDEPAVEGEPGPGALLALAFGFRGDADRPASWQGTFDAVASGLRWGDVSVENLSLKAAAAGPEPGPLAATLRFEQAGTKLEAGARVDLAGAGTLGDLRKLPVLLDADLSVKDLGLLLADLAPSRWKTFPLTGSLEGRIEGLRFESGSVAGGVVSLHSADLALEDEGFESFALSARIPGADQVVASVDLGLDPVNSLRGEGEIHLRRRTYEGRLDLVADLVSEASSLRRVLGGTRLRSLLPGRTALSWEGSGAFGTPDHVGRISLEAGPLVLADGAEAIDLAVKGDYRGNSARFPEFTLRSRPLDLEGSMTWEGGHLSLEAAGRSGGRETLRLEGRLPLETGRLGANAWFTQESPILLSLKLDELPVETVFRLFASRAPVRGSLSLDLSAGGTPARPTLGAELSLAGISVPREGGDLPAGRLDLVVEAPGDTLLVKGDYRHPDVQPLALRASLPFHPAAWATGARPFREETLEATAKMERSSLAFLVGQVPGIESISGEVALDAAVTGSLAAPGIRGSGMLDLSRLRLENRNAPSLHDVSLVARFEENRIVLETLRAIVAGGTVEGRGEARFQPGGEPQIRVELKGSEVLVVRTPDLNVRTDLDLTLAGPWSRASLSGEAGITNSRYSRHFDLLPVGFPAKRGTSALPTVERTPRGGGKAYQDLEIGVPLAPFRDWPVSLRVHTKDPFLVQSNLAQSSISGDLKFVGTLGRPNPVGSVTVDAGRLDLPFSRIDVETGRIEFDEATGFNGAIEFKARGKADRYQIAIYLHDRLFSPKYVLTSLPPLASEDILTLLATGTTRDELVSEDAGSMAATKAATLLFRNLQQANDRAGADPTFLDLLEDRTELELGRVNQETGEQTFGGKVRLWKQLFLAGDVDVNSNYRALLKYVFRFE